MICLAVNTATTILSVAIHDGANCLFHYATPETRDQGNLLMRHIQEGLVAAGIGFADIGLLAAATGPGSFTGIRIGLAAMRGIALAADLPITGLSSFDLFAEPAAGRRNVVAVESWREELYFKVDEAEAVNLSPQDFAATLGSGAYHVSGDAAQKLAPFMPADTTYATTLPDARRLAEMALAQNGRHAEPVPFYLRPADAKLASDLRKIAE